MNEFLQDLNVMIYISFEIGLFKLTLAIVHKYLQMKQKDISVLHIPSRCISSLMYISFFDIHRSRCFWAMIISNLAFNQPQTVQP